MDILVKKTNRTIYQLQSDVAVCLLEAFPEHFERVAPRPHFTNEPAYQGTPVAPAQNKWRVVISDSGQKAFVVDLPRGEQTRFSGRVDSGA